MIEICNLSKSFGTQKVIDGLNLKIDDGIITAIAGPNGSGKTTMIKTILGLVKHDSGDIFIDGKNLKKQVEYKRFIGYMPQIGRYPDNLTIQEIFNMVSDIRNSKVTNSTELIELFQLGPFLKKQMRALSGGTRQKVSAVLALMFSPQLLILDEPTTGLDPISAGRLKDIIIEEKGKNRTIILISHIMSEIEELADKLVYLLDGKIRINEDVVKLRNISGESTLERAIAKMI